MTYDMLYDNYALTIKKIAHEFEGHGKWKNDKSGYITNTFQKH